MRRTPGTRPSRTRRTAVSALLTGGVLIGGMLVAGTSVADSPDSPDSTTDAGTTSRTVTAGPSAAGDFRFPGADTMRLRDGSGRYITYGASAKGRKVPYAIHGSGENVGTTGRIDGDAMPRGGPGWVDKRRNIWTPSPFFLKKNGVERYYLFYTGALRSDRDAADRENRMQKRCVGMAWSTRPTGGFEHRRRPLACPSKRTRWALDADVSRRPNSAIWMTWRDGQRANGPESALSAVRLKFHDNGNVSRDNRARVLLRSDNIAWAEYRDSGVTVIENPSLVLHRGHWYMFYSGNSWKTNYYSTGVAYCGTTLLKGTCEPMPGPNRAWFSYSGPKKHLPDRMRLRGLPGNHRGPGAMDLYRAHGGQTWVTWNYLTGDTGTGRRSTTGKLVITGTGPDARFAVRK